MTVPAGGRLYEMATAPRSMRELEPVIGAERCRRVEQAAGRLRAHLAGRRVVNINTSASGGGAAEMLRDLVPYVRDFGVDCRWLVLDGDADFFAVTKRIHNRIYGFPGDDERLDGTARRRYERTHAGAAEQLSGFVRAGDVVLIHDPQPLGLAPALRSLGARTVWRCHVGTDHLNDHSTEAWAFLRPYFDAVDAAVFHRAVFAPSWLVPSTVFVIPPSINPLALKNQPIDAETADRVLTWYGLREGPAVGAPVAFTARDGSTRFVRRRADILQSGPPAPRDAPFVVQISRWDPMKDMAGVLTAFADHLADLGDAHLALVGPAVSGTADDPTGAQVLTDCMSRWQRLSHEARSRIHLACLPMADLEENAYVVNALQRRADVVVQKSLSEGFGLTVTEAMWKSRPVVGGAVGGIQEQITDGTGVLVNPGDPAAFAAELGRLLAAPERMAAIGQAAHARIRSHFLPDRHLLQYADLLLRLLDAR